MKKQNGRTKEVDILIREKKDKMRCSSGLLH